MAPLAGKPPFATDEPDSFYESPAPQRRVPPPPPPNPNSRTSAYNVYDNYLTADNGDSSANRQSGVGALGMGLMNLSDSDDDDSDDELSHKKPAPASKNAALAAATRPVPRSPTASLPDTSPKQTAEIQPQPQQIQHRQEQQEQQHPTIAAPRPGYAAPIAALNLARPESAATRSSPQPIQVPSSRLENPFEPPMAQIYNPNRSPIPLPPSPTNPPSAPHPLQAPITPITPVFARPGVNFSEPIPRVKPVMRGANEETLLPRRGEKGDDFWRRFSMVAKIENGKPGGSKQSWWLKKTQNGSSRLSRWVWVVAFVIILCIAGVSVLGWRASQNKPAHQAPTALGGSANERPGATTSSSAPVASGSSGAQQSSIKHVSPTHTVARREAQPTGVAVPLGHARAARRRLFDSVVAH